MVTQRKRKRDEEARHTDTIGDFETPRIPPMPHPKALYCAPTIDPNPLEIPIERITKLHHIPPFDITPC